jgi:hypothetical protein
MRIAVIGAWIVPARIAPIPTRAYAPGFATAPPGQIAFTPTPKAVPSSAPTKSDGVKSPPGTPPLRQSPVTTILRIGSAMRTFRGI